MPRLMLWYLPLCRVYVPFSFLMSVIWIALYTYCMVWWATIVGMFFLHQLF